LIRLADGWHVFDEERDGVVPRKDHPSHAT
jgi:hypothetical protein